MKIDKKLIRELVDSLKEFDLTELEYQDGPTKLRFPKHLKPSNKLKLALLSLQINQYLNLLMRAKG